MIDAGQIIMLMVEDNAADVFFFREALEVTALPVSLHVVADGAAALEFLRRKNAFADSPRPDVVVLDLNLPIMNGQEVLVKMMSYPELRDIPVAVLTTSTSETHVCDICPPGRCLYFTKTDDFVLLQNIIRQIVQHGRSKPA